MLFWVKNLISSIKETMLSFVDTLPGPPKSLKSLCLGHYCWDL